MILFILLIGVSIYTRILKPRTSITQYASESSIFCGVYCSLPLAEGVKQLSPFAACICSSQLDTTLSCNARLRLTYALTPVHYFHIIYNVTFE